MITDQAEADEDTSIKNRALMAIGKNSGVSDSKSLYKLFFLRVILFLVNRRGADINLYEYRLSKTGHFTLRKPVYTTGSTADGVADLDQFGDVQAVAKEISKAAEKLEDKDKKSSSSSSSSSEDDDEARNLISL